MVGAIADWFAVTALFKHPLGLPIPHTALIPKRKDDARPQPRGVRGRELPAGEVIRDRLEVAELSRAGRGLAVERNARGRRRGRDGAAHRAATVRDEDLAALVEEALLPRFRAEPISPIAGSLLEEIVRDARTTVWSTWRSRRRTAGCANEETFTEIVGERAPWWSPPALNERVTHRLHLERCWLDRRHPRRPGHHARTALDGMLAQLAEDLLHDPATQERAERLKERVLDHPQVLVTATSLWNACGTPCSTRSPTPTARCRRALSPS